MIEEYQSIINEMRDRTKESQQHGFSREQYPFYQILEAELKDDLENKELIKDLTHTITDTLENEAVVEWTEKEDVKRQMRKKVKRHLRLTNCPREKMEPLTHQLIELAGVHYRK
jgi:type I restriction enzyme, R subunit